MTNYQLMTMSDGEFLRTRSRSLHSNSLKVESLRQWVESLWNRTLWLNMATANCLSCLQIAYSNNPLETLYRVPVGSVVVRLDGAVIIDKAEGRIGTVRLATGQGRLKGNRNRSLPAIDLDRVVHRVGVISVVEILVAIQATTVHLIDAFDWFWIDWLNLIGLSVDWFTNWSMYLIDKLIDCWIWLVYRLIDLLID